MKRFNFSLRNIEEMDEEEQVPVISMMPNFDIEKSPSKPDDQPIQDYQEVYDNDHLDEVSKSIEEFRVNCHEI